MFNIDCFKTFSKENDLFCHFYTYIFTKFIIIHIYFQPKADKLYQKKKRKKKNEIQKIIRNIFVARCFLNYFLILLN